MGDTNNNISNSTATNQGEAIAFIQRWQGVQLTQATELASSQTFILELCALLGVPTPLPTPEQDYMFERPITFAHGDGSTSAGRIDCYKRNHFVWESKKLRAVKTASPRFDAALLTARTQAESYARALPAAELSKGRPPFLLVADVGNVIELYAEFTKSGATYTPFPDPRSHRIALADLVKPEVRERLAFIWTDPDSLNPARASARVTREVAAQLADLAKSLEASGHRADHVAAFLTRSLFSMFAEDVELLPKGSFLHLLRQHRAQPAVLQNMLRALWADMDVGGLKDVHGQGFSAVLAGPVMRFNGKLFKESASDGYSLLLKTEQIDRLAKAAQADWRLVEPAIFGTLLERALSSTERHALGAHYTPRAYVERLVLPTVVEPLRADWANAQAAALVLANDGKMDEARAEVRRFLHQLCNTRVLDPACGSGNFLYVTLEHLKRLEGEVLNQLEAFGQTQDKLGFDGETVSLQQLRGIELNDRAAALAELVLWIGYLQWHIRTRGNKAVAEPVVHDYGNIECRDAVLAWDDIEPAVNDHGQPLLRWDGSTKKPHPVTGELVPDEDAQIAVWRYIRPRKARWPQADFIVGNPPFIGKLKMREALGDGYVETLRDVWRDVPDSADFVMYWWNHAANLVAKDKVRRLGLITTNSLAMIYNRRVVQAAMDEKVGIVFAIPDHPWVDSADGAAVRIAMTVAAKNPINGELQTVIEEHPGEQGETQVTVSGQVGMIHANLSVGADLDSAQALQANKKISSAGVIPHGEGMLVTALQAEKFEHEAPVRPYRNGKDLTDKSRDLLVIDCYGLKIEEVRNQFPTLYHWLVDRVKPDRDANRDKDLREKWWLHRRSNEEMRRALKGLPRYIATVMTSKHRVFQFLSGNILPDQKLVAIGLKESFYLGVLSSTPHTAWATATGGHLGVGNDPVYSKTLGFETFPFPDDDTGLTPALRERIGALAEQIDAHRKRQQAAHPGLTLTGMYNVLQARRTQAAAQRSGAQVLTLTAKEKTINTQGLVAVLQDLHNELDAAVLAAYGWDDMVQPLGQAQVEGMATPGQQLGAQANNTLLERLVALNQRRVTEEKTGYIRWLRPEFQNPVYMARTKTLQNKELLAHIPRWPQADLALEDAPKPAKVTKTAAAPALAASAPTAWPAALPDQVRAVAAVLQAASAPLSLADLQAHFKGRGAWKNSLPRILETLEALSRARQDAGGWRA